MTVARFCPTLLGVLALGCGGDARDQTAPVADPPAPKAQEPTAPPEDPPDPDVVDFDFEGELDEALMAEGVVPAWDAVIDRHRWLERRGVRGAIWGRLGAADGDYRWLIDDSQGAGSLAVRAALPSGMKLADGDRAILHGAWAVDDAHRWFWRVTGAARLPAAEDREPEPLAATAPGHVIETISGFGPVRTVSRVDNNLRFIMFEVVRGPRRPGDGWVIGDRSHFEPAAVLRLPGERDPYGGQDYLTPDERWSLEPKVRYLIRVGRSDPPRRAGELRQLRALTPPKRLDPKDVK